MKIHFLGFQISDTEAKAPVIEISYGSPKFDAFTYITKSLSAKIRQRIFSYVLPSNQATILENAAVFSDVLAFAEHSELSIRVDILSNLEVESLYTGTFILDWGKHNDLITKVPIKEIVFNSDALLQYPHLISRARNIIYEYDSELYNPDIDYYYLSNVTVLNCVKANEIPPHSFIERCKSLNKIIVNISNSFGNFEKLKALCYTGKFIVIKLHRPSQELLDCRQFQHLVEVPSVSFQVKQLVLTKDKEDSKMIGFFSIEELIMNEDSFIMQNLPQVNVLKLTVPITNQSLFKSTYIRSLICQFEDEINFSFGGFTKLNYLGISDNISKESFESVPDSVIHLNIFSTQKKSPVHFDKFPKSLLSLTADFNAFNFESLESCGKTLSLVKYNLNVKSPERITTFPLWKYMPQSIKRVDLRLNIKNESFGKAAELIIDEPVQNLYVQICCVIPEICLLATTGLRSQDIKALERALTKIKKPYVLIKGFSFDLKLHDKSLINKVYLPIVELNQLTVTGLLQKRISFFF